MIKIKILFETKKGCAVVTQWGIRQITPYPDFEGSCGSFRWRNGGGLFPQWRPTGMEKPTIGREYDCVMLRSDTEEHDFASRTCHAGYVEDERLHSPPTPGSFELRGVYMGEVSVQYQGNPTWPSIKVRGYKDPTDGERTFIKEKICTCLESAIECHRDELKAQAIAELIKRVGKTMAEARGRLTKLETEIHMAINIAAR